MRKPSLENGDERNQGKQKLQGEDQQIRFQREQII